MRARHRPGAAVSPENDLVHYEFIRMPDSSGFGNYTESGQVISVLRPEQGRSRQLHAFNVPR